MVIIRGVSKREAPSTYRAVGAALVQEQMDRRGITWKMMALDGVPSATLQRFIKTELPMTHSKVKSIEHAAKLEHDLLMRTLAGQTTLIAAMDTADDDLKKWLLGQLRQAGAPRPDMTPGAWEKASG
jgi:hypothetical protein